jgi:manganese transport protein
MKKKQPNSPNPNNLRQSAQSLSEVHSTVETNVKGNFFKRLFAFMGPAYLVSVGYMDPGNWATDLAGGSRFGYSLLWVLLMSNLIALLVAKHVRPAGRGGATRPWRKLPANLYHPAANIFNYILAEIAIAATDLAEVWVWPLACNCCSACHLPGAWYQCARCIFAVVPDAIGHPKIGSIYFRFILIIGGAFAGQMFLAKPD